LSFLRQETLRPWSFELQRCVYCEWVPKFGGNITIAHETVISKNTVLNVTTADTTGLRTKQGVSTANNFVNVSWHSSSFSEEISETFNDAGV